MQKSILIAVPLLLLIAACGESTPPKAKKQADAPAKSGVSPEAPPAMMRVEYYEISKK